MLEFIHTVAWSNYYFIIYLYIHNKVSLRSLKDQIHFCGVYSAAAVCPASKQHKQLLQVRYNLTVV